MIQCDEFTAELLDDGQTEPDTEVRVTNRKTGKTRIFRYAGPYVTAEYVNEHGFLDFKRFCEEVVFFDAACDGWREDKEVMNRRLKADGIL